MLFHCQFIRMPLLLLTKHTFGHYSLTMEHVLCVHLYGHTHLDLERESSQRLLKAGRLFTGDLRHHLIFWPSGSDPMFLPIHTHTHHTHTLGSVRGLNRLCSVPVSVNHSSSSSPAFIPKVDTLKLQYYNQWP